MIKKLNYYCAFILLLSACSKEKETITFETITAEKTVALSNDSIPPTCSVTIHLDQATAESGRAGEIINATVAKQLFNHGDDGLQQAAEAFAEEYTTNYVKTLLPLYNHDRQDSTKSTWYHYHYIINSHTQAGSPSTLVYLADINSREGNAHAISQQVVMNFDTATGRRLPQGNRHLRARELHPLQRCHHLRLQPRRDRTLQPRQHRTDHFLYRLGKDTQRYVRTLTRLRLCQQTSY